MWIKFCDCCEWDFFEDLDLGGLVEVLFLIDFLCKELSKFIIRVGLF